MSALVLYTNEENCLYESLLKAHHTILPKEIKDKAVKFRRWQDRQAFILGRLLIWKGLKHHNYEDDCLAKLQNNRYGKPFIDQDIFFNLSHSGRYVMCAFYKEEIGIDIEEIIPIDIHDFNSSLSEQEKNHVLSSPQPLKAFFRLWTIKESVIKAEGKGLSIPLQQVNASSQGFVQLNAESWHIKEISLFKGYCCSIASRTKLSSLVLEKVNCLVQI